MSIPIDIDEQMLKVMDVQTHCEDGGGWKTVNVLRDGRRVRIWVKKKSTLAIGWHPSTNIQDAMDIIARFTEPGEAAAVELSHDYNNHCWRATIHGEYAYASTLPLAICCAVLKYIEKNEPAVQEEE